MAQLQDHPRKVILERSASWVPMPFDWFRRKPKDEKPPEPGQTPAPAAPAQDTAAPEDTAATPAQTATAQQPDYLAFAKAAYANLKAKQEGAAADLAAVVDTSDAADSLANPPAEPSETVSTPTEALDTPAAPEPPTATTTAEPPRAFFEMAPRQEPRLVVVDDEAPAEPALTPANPPLCVSPTTEASPTVRESDLEFDEGFRWSAEILAAQGRKAEDITFEEISWLQKLRQGLGKTRRSLVIQLRSLVGQGPLTAEAVDDIETLLLQADVGVAATDDIIAGLQAQVRQEALPADQAVAYLKTQLRELLDIGEPSFAPVKGQLNIWLMVGVNGVGKTTTLGKLASLAQQSGYRCLIAAADTFRAAAVKQLQVWGDRAGVEVIANESANADPAAVVFDAVAAAQARGVDLLLVDTAGRLQNKKNLMAELSKIRRIVDKKAAGAQVEALLVLDATLGQNGLRQAQVFAEAAELTGVILTKLDGTAKGGVALAVVKELGLPIRFIGVGEAISDLRPFSSYEFVEALLSD